MSNVIYLDTKLDIPADRVLEAAVGNMETVILIGYGMDGKEYFASSTTKAGDILLLLKKFERHLLDNLE